MSDTNLKIVHEMQSRQLCAMHTINNLLQLTSTTEDLIGSTSMEGKGSSATLSCCTKIELDMIADELTLAEKRLLGDEQQKLYLLDIIFSKHRTIWLGNYSVEVIQEALRRRHVHLEWLTANQVLNMSESSSSEHSLIGWILNKPMEEMNLWKRLVLPKNRRHWFAITKIPSNVRHHENNIGTRWMVLDSNGSVPTSSHQYKFDSLSLLVEYLINQMNRGCIVLKASATDDFVPMS